MKFRIKKNKIEKIGLIIKKLPRQMAEHFFYAILVFLVIVFFLGGVIFYQYNFLANNRNIRDISNNLNFKEEVYQKILSVLDKRETRFNESDNKSYSNPFQPILQGLTK